MVAPTVDVLRRLATSIHEEIGSRQGSKHSSPNISKDITALMNSLDSLDVYRYTEGRVLDDEEMPVPDAISVGLAALSHGSGTNPLSEFNSNWAIACARRRLVPVSSLLSFLDLDDPLADERLGGKHPSVNTASTTNLSPDHSHSDLNTHPTLISHRADLGDVSTPPEDQHTALAATPHTVENDSEPFIPLSSDLTIAVDGDNENSVWEDEESSSEEGNAEGYEGNEDEDGMEDGLVGVDDNDIASDVGEPQDDWDSDDEQDEGLFVGGSEKYIAGEDSDGFVGVEDETDSESDGWETN